jgi:hypothetical protein
VCVCVCGVCVCVQPASHSVYHTSGASEASSGVLYQAIVFFFWQVSYVGGIRGLFRGAVPGNFCSGLRVLGVLGFRVSARV